jgi:hypothetical protein
MIEGVILATGLTLHSFACGPIAWRSTKKGLQERPVFIKTHLDSRSALSFLFAISTLWPTPRNREVCTRTGRANLALRHPKGEYAEGGEYFTTRAGCRSLQNEANM